MMCDERIDKSTEEVLVLELQSEELDYTQILLVD